MRRSGPRRHHCQNTRACANIQHRNPRLLSKGTTEELVERETKERAAASISNFDFLAGVKLDKSKLQVPGSTRLRSYNSGGGRLADYALAYLRIIPVRRRGSYSSFNRSRVGLISGRMVQHPEVPPIDRQAFDIFQALQRWPEPGIQRQCLRGDKTEKQYSIVFIWMRHKTVIYTPARNLWLVFLANG